MKVFRIEYSPPGLWLRPHYKDVIADTEADALAKANFPSDFQHSNYAVELTPEFMVSMAGSVEKYIDFINKHAAQGDD